MINSQMFGILLTVGVFLFWYKILVNIKFPLFNPLLISTITIISILIYFKIPYSSYNFGAQIFTTAITPATVALAVPLYRNFHLLRKHYKSILSGIIIGNTINCIIVGFICKILAYQSNITASFLTKSVTTAIAIDLSEHIGGISSIAIVLVMLTGITGAAIGPTIFRWLDVDDHVVVGVSLGASSHAVGTSKAIEISEEAGAISGLCIGLTGIYVIFIAPMIIKVII